MSRALLWVARGYRTRVAAWSSTSVAVLRSGGRPRERLIVRRIRPADAPPSRPVSPAAASPVRAGWRGRVCRPHGEAGPPARLPQDPPLGNEVHLLGVL